MNLLEGSRTVSDRAQRIARLLERIEGDPRWNWRISQRWRNLWRAYWDEVDRNQAAGIARIRERAASGEL